MQVLQFLKGCFNSNRGVVIGTRAVVIGIEVGVEIEVIRHRSPKSAYDLVKMKKNKALAESYRLGRPNCGRKIQNIFIFFRLGL